MAAGERVGIGEISLHHLEVYVTIPFRLEVGRTGSGKVRYVSPE